MWWFGRGVVAALVLGCTGAACAASPPTPDAQQEAARLAELPPVVPHGRWIDHSGRKQKGRASYYARHFDHRKMASGQRFNPDTNVAASKTLPFGTTARVTNLRNGRSAMVRVEDRGPWIDGRVVDLTPKVAGELGIREAGVAPVVVAPVAVPQKNGEVKLGAGAADASPQEVEQATVEAEAETR
jgi:rare lipoprotein A